MVVTIFRECSVSIRRLLGARSHVAVAVAPNLRTLTLAKGPNHVQGRASPAGNGANAAALGASAGAKGTSAAGKHVFPFEVGASAAGNGALPYEVGASAHVKGMFRFEHPARPGDRTTWLARFGGTPRLALVGALSSMSVLAPMTAAFGQCPAWVVGVGTPGANGRVKAILVHPSGDVIVGGEFNSAGGVPATGIARYTPSTNTWSAIGSGVGPSGGFVNGLALTSQGDVIVGGTFTIAGGQPAGRVARLNVTTGAWTPLGTLDARVNAVAVSPTGEIFAGGLFVSSNGAPVNRIARYDQGTNTWVPLGTGTGTNGGGGVEGSGQVYAIHVLPGGDVLVGGGFQTAGGAPARNLARYRPSSDTWVPLPNFSSYGNVFDIKSLSGSRQDELLIARAESNQDAQTSGVVTYNLSTGLWSAVGTRIPNTVTCVGVLPDGRIVVGGQFTAFVGPLTLRNVASFDFVTNRWSELGSGVDSIVDALAILPPTLGGSESGDVFFGGLISTAGGLAQRIARYQFGVMPPRITNQPVQQIACLSGSATFSVVAEGTGPLTFEWRRNGVAINAALNPTAASPNLVLSPVVPSDLGQYVCAVSNPCLVALSQPATLTICQADFNCSGGSPTVQDVLDFLASWFGGASSANVNGDCCINTQDIFDFLATWFAGCN